MSKQQQQPKKLDVKTEPKVTEGTAAPPKRTFVPNVAVKREKKK